MGERLEYNVLWGTGRMALEEYGRKRDFKKTPEPPPEVAKKTVPPPYCPCGMVPSNVP